MAKSNDSTGHPMYYTETYHRALVDKDFVGAVSGITGGAAGGIAGAIAAKPLVKNIIANAENIRLPGSEGLGKLNASELETYWKELPKGVRLSSRLGTAAVGALAVGVVTASIGACIGYLNALRKGPNPEQAANWAGRVEGEKAESNQASSR